MEYKVHGAYAPIPTPFDERGDIDYDHLQENLARWGRSSLDGIVVMGSNGEAVALNETERCSLMGFVREHLPADKRLIVGTGTESLRNTTTLNREAARIGADAVLVVNPTYYRGALTPQALVTYYKQVADLSPVPVMLYNMPGNTGINLAASTVLQAAEHDNIIGIKDSGGNIAQIAAVINGSKPGFCVFAGSAGFLLPTLYLGGCGGTMALANVAPDHCQAIFTALADGDHDAARAAQMAVLDLNQAVTAEYGVPGLKYALSCIGYYGGPSRSPLRREPTEEAKAHIRRLLFELGLTA